MSMYDVLYSAIAFMTFFSGFLFAVLIFFRFVYVPLKRRIELLEAQIEMKFNRRERIAKMETAKLRSVIYDPLVVQKKRGQFFKYKQSNSNLI